QACGLAPAPVLPREIRIPAAPDRAALVIALCRTDRSQIADGNDGRIGRRCALFRAAPVAERADLPGGSQLYAGLLSVPETQPRLQRPVLAGREGNAWKGSVTLPLAQRGRQGGGTRYGA